MNTIEELNLRQMEALTKDRNIPSFSSGDTLRVSVRVTEGTRTRIQAYEGVCIARKGGGLQESFTVRKMSYGEGVERVFPLYSPMIEKIEVVRRGRVRRAKLYYLRGRSGKSARIVEATNARARSLNEVQRQAAAQEKKRVADAKKAAQQDASTQADVASDT